MAVTDLTDSLPWWARQGTGPGGVMPGGGVMGYPATSGGGPNMGYPAQGAGPTGTPSATPQGGGGAASAPTGGPPPGVSPQAWLQYLQQMFGVSPAQAGGQNINAALNAGGTPPVNNSINANVVPPMSNGPPNGASLLDQSGVTRMGGPGGVLNTQPPTGASAPVGASLLDQSGIARNSGGVLQPGLNPNVPAANAQPVRGPMASGGAGGQLSTSNPRFVQIDRPNAPANGGPYGRAGAPQMTALNLAGMFNRGQPGPNPNVPAANAQAVSAVNGPLARPDLAQRVPLANAPMPPTMPASIANQRVANAVSSPNWWQNL